jgi:Tfp pilus assembly protein PilX
MTTFQPDPQLELARRGSRGEQGIALIVAVLMLVMMGMIGLASLETVTQDRQVAGSQSRARAALWAAEAGLQTARGTLFTASLPQGIAALNNFAPALATTSLGDAALYPYGLPSFSADPAAAQPIDYLGAGTPCDAWVTSLEQAGSGSQAVWRDSLWDLRVRGQTTDGADARLQAMGTRCYPYSS